MNRFAVLLLVILSGCESVPEYAPPAQRPLFEGYKPRAARVVNMEDVDAALHFVRDFSYGTPAWRWTLQRPAVKIKVRTDDPLKYTIDFTLPEVTFKDTGPVTIAFTVNDRVLDRVRYTAPGYQHFEKAVPRDWIPNGQDATIGAEIDKMWTSKEDGSRLGFIITRIGLAE